MAEIILKYDDLCEDTVDAFLRIYRICEKRRITPSFGVIGSSLKNGGSRYIDSLVTMKEKGVEFWNHGYFHAIEEFSTNNYSEQLESIAKTQKFMQDKLGIIVNTFGSPYNNSSEITVKVLSENFPEIKNYFFMVCCKQVATAKQILLRCNYEITTGKVNKLFFENEYMRVRDYPYMVLQGHPGVWKQEDFDLHEQIIDRLIDDGNTIVTPEILGCKQKVPRMELPYGKDLLDYMNSFKMIAFYGAAETGREFYRFAELNGVKPDCFVISDGQKRIHTTLCDLPVYFLSEFKEKMDVQNIGVVLTLYQNLHREVIQQLKSSGINVWTKYNAEEYGKLVDYVRYYISQNHTEGK